MPREPSSTVSTALISGGLAAVAVGSALAARRHERRRRVAERLWRPERTPRAWPRADHPLVVGTAVAMAASIGWVLSGIVEAIAAASAVIAAPRWLRRRADRRRERAIEQHLPQVVSVVASAMRTGRSLAQALGIAAEEVDAPLGPSLGRLVARVDLGDPLDEAIEAWATELGHPDARLAAGVLQLHRRTGGALAAALEDLAGTLRARRDTLRELRSLTAQARLSATILGLLPLGFFLFLSIVAREDIRGAFRSPIGMGAIVLGLFLQGVAYVWIRHLLRIEP